MVCSMPGLPVHHPLPELAQTHVHWVNDVIQPSYSLSSPSPPLSILPSIRVFSNESVLHIRWPKYWSFSFSISPSNEYSGLISFRIDQFDLFAVQVTLKSLLQHHSSKASIHWSVQQNWNFFFKVKISVGKTQEDFVLLIHFIPFYQIPTISLLLGERAKGGSKQMPMWSMDLRH